jgi:hypothetical protein
VKNVIARLIPDVSIARRRYAADPPSLPTPPSRAAGVALAAVLGTVARITRRKPLHAVGRTWDAVLRVDAPVPGLGVPLLDERGVHACTFRVSRALSTRPGWWDIGGVAIRVPGAGAVGRPADLLFATTGTGRVTRHVLRPVRFATEQSLTTLLPTRAAGHSVVLLLQPTALDDEPLEYELAVSVDGGPWRIAGLVELRDELPPANTRFDPIVNELYGTSAPPWVVAIREPAYRWARRLGRRTPSGDT